MKPFFRKKCFNRRIFKIGINEIIRAEREGGFGLSLRERVRALSSGFTAESWVLYSFGDRPNHHYLPDVPHLLYTKAINKDRQVFQDKIIFPAVYGGMLDIPKNLCMINRGKVLPLARDEGLTRDLDSVLKWCQRSGPMIWKPNEGNGGKAVQLISYAPPDSFLLNGRPASRTELQELANSRTDFVVSPAVQQGRYAQAVFPAAVNTVRIWTMIDPLDGRAFIAGAAHRFGTNKSVPVDNWAAGGLVAPINLENGELDKAASKPVSGRTQWFDIHPDTQAPIAGLRIPNWKNLTNALLEVTEAYSRISHCAWDVVAREDGFSVLEGNNLPTLTMLQLRGGLLKDERARRFFEHHELLAPKTRTAKYSRQNGDRY